jgi:hypothetical protein
MELDQLQPGQKDKDEHFQRPPKKNTSTKRKIPGATRKNKNTSKETPPRHVSSSKVYSRLMSIMVAKTKKHREKSFQNGLPVGAPTVDAIKIWSLLETYVQAFLYEPCISVRVESHGKYDQ